MVKQRSWADVNSSYKRKCWTNSRGALVSSLLWESYSLSFSPQIYILFILSSSVFDGWETTGSVSSLQTTFLLCQRKNTCRIPSKILFFLQNIICLFFLSYILLVLKGGPTFNNRWLGYIVTVLGHPLIHILNIFTQWHIRHTIAMTIFFSFLTV
jgi:hypothetical protein